MHAIYGVADTGRRVTIRDLAAAKAEGRRWPMITAYDAVTARLFDDAGIPVMLVGDSAAMVVYGYDSTVPITVEELVPLVRAVVRGSSRALVVADLPFGSYQASPAQALETAARFMAYVERFATRRGPATQAGFLVFQCSDDALVGVFNFSEIVRGAFCSTYLGYFGFAPHAGRGLMTEGMALALDVAFRELGLHRVEVNIQPTNARSLALAQRVGFAREGYSRRYVKIAGRWRDHVRLAMLAEDWRTLRRAHLGQRPRRA